MTGDATLQVMIFAIGLVVFGMAMIGGLLVMRDWYARDNAQSAGDFEVEPTWSFDPGRQPAPVPVPVPVRSDPYGRY
jgi:hypothetical protein